MKKIILIQICCLITIRVNSNMAFFNQSKMPADSIALFLNNFYTEYITEASKTSAYMPEINLIKKKYCSQNLLRAIERQNLDYDPFLKAQDCDLNWLKTLNICMHEKYNNIYIVTYLDSYSNTLININLSIVKYSDGYKIVSVW